LNKRDSMMVKYGKEEKLKYTERDTRKDIISFTNIKYLIIMI